MFLWLASKTVFSADASGDAISQEIPVPELTPTGEVGVALFKMILALLLLCAALFATLWLIRRFIHHRFQKGSGIQSIRVLEKKMLSPKSMLYLVEIDGKKVLLAESQLEVRRLHSWHEEIPAEGAETED